MRDAVLIGLVVVVTLQAIVLAWCAFTLRKWSTVVRGIIDAAASAIRRAQAGKEHEAAVEAWKAELAEHPEGSPRHASLVKRLREVGAL